MTQQFVVYTEATGVPVRIGNVTIADDTDISIQAVFMGEAAILVDDEDTAYKLNEVYVDITGDPVVVAKTSLDTICTLTGASSWTADGVDTIVYGSSLPNPTEVRITCDNPAFGDIRGYEFVGSITDGTLTLATPITGNYTITLNAWPWAPKVISVEAT